MPDPMDVLRSLPHAVTPDQASPDVVADDVARGRRALNRRRWRFASSGAAVVAVAAVALAVPQLGQPESTQPTTADGPATATTADGSAATATPDDSETSMETPRLELVAYTGDQPAGFVVSTVPEGWQVVSSDPSQFVVEPPDQDPPPPAPGDSVNLDGRLAVMLLGQSRLPDESPTTEVDINGKTGQLGFPWETMGELSDTRWLIFPDASDQMVLVQIPAGLGLSDSQIVQFAAGITVTNEAESPTG